MCTYRSISGSICARPSVPGSSYCVLHAGLAVPAGTELPEDPTFQPALDSLVAASDGNWDGFVFPPNVAWPARVDFPVNARGCRFAEFDLNSVQFAQQVDFSDSVFDSGMVLRACKFDAPVTFDRCRFSGSVDILNTKFGAASFYRAEFSGRTVLRANFAGAANFNEAVFRESVTFAGWRNISMSVQVALSGVTAFGIGAVVGNRAPPSVLERIRKSVAALVAAFRRTGHKVRKQIRALADHARTRWNRFRRRYAKRDPNTERLRVFESEGQLQNVIFMRPEQTVFSDVDFSKVSFRGTNLRGVQFLGVNWWQPRLGRNGLYDEVLLLSTDDGPYRRQSLPALEETCRNVRVALEESRNFDAASDFYIAELDAHRRYLAWPRRLLFSIPAIYRIVSIYGTSVGRALIVMLALVGAHAACTVWISFGGTELDGLGKWWHGLSRSVRVLIFQSNDLSWRAVRPGQIAADTAFRVLGLVQIAMVVLAFRSRIKRN